MTHIGRRTLGALLAAIAIGAGATPAKAAFNNGGFESGFTSWTTIGGAASITGSQAPFGSYVVNPFAGSAMARLTPGSASAGAVESFLGIASGSLNGLANGTPTNGTAIMQTITAVAGTVMTFKWNFNESDYLPFNDFAFVSISPGSTSELADVATFGPGSGTGTSGWQTFSYTFTTAGTYKIGVGTFNVIDTAASPILYVDNFSSLDPVAVPAPPAVVLFGVGLAGLAGFRRLRRKTEQFAVA